jgi:hypothetical protein
MNTSDTNEFMGPFGFVDDVDPAEREMREYDSLVAAGQLGVGTASIADLLASTDPAMTAPEPADEGPGCRGAGRTATAPHHRHTIDWQLGGGDVGCDGDSSGRYPDPDRVAVIDPMTLTGAAIERPSPRGAAPG